MSPSLPSGSSRTPTGGKSCGSSSPTSASTSTKPSKVSAFSQALQNPNLRINRLAERKKIWIRDSWSLSTITTSPDDFPLASLPLLGYTVNTPSPADEINKDYVFKLQFKNHVYFFRAESQFTFDRSPNPHHDCDQHRPRWNINPDFHFQVDGGPQLCDSGARRPRRPATFEWGCLKSALGSRF